MRRSWTAPEDETLRRLVGIHGKQWGLIASQMDNRTASQVSARWEKCLDPKLAKGPFTQEEDALILSHVEKHGPQNWPALSQVLVRRSPKQCRERWCNHLNPSVSSSSWSPEEDALVFEHHERHGPKWSLIAKVLPGRTDNAIKNRWNSSLAKRIHIGPAGKRNLVPDTLRKKKRTTAEQPQPERPPPIETAPEQAQANVVPLDISQLSPWQLQILQQMNILPPGVGKAKDSGKMSPNLEVPPSMIDREATSLSPQLPIHFGMFTPPSPFGMYPALAAPGHIMPFGEGTEGALSPGQGRPTVN